MNTMNTENSKINDSQTNSEVRQRKKVIFSGVQPSGYPSIGNYFGALKNWTKLQNDYNCLFCIVDMHAITVRQDAATLRKNSRDMLALYIAVGLDPEKNIMYMQSHVPAHAELAWILNCYTYMGELSRMTQFKEKSRSHSENINAGLFDYPVLMAADILLFNTDMVPVGEDQRQHLELARNVAERFNKIYGDVFTVPEPYIQKIGAKIMSLQEPTKKMSKSDKENANNTIFLLDDLNVAANKIKRAVTDSDNEVKYSDEKPGIKNLINIYCAVTGKTIEQTEDEFSGKGYGVFKAEVAEALVEELRPVQAKFKEISQNKDYIDSILKQNAEKANAIAARVLNKVKKKIGFVV